MREKVDKRFQKSEKRILRGLAKLMKKCKSISIKVKELCLAARISSSTFYRHYRNVNEVLTKYEEEILQKFEAEMRQLQETASTRQIFRQTLIFIYKKQGYFRVALMYGHLFMIRKLIKELDNFMELQRRKQMMSPLMQEIFEHEMLGLIASWGQRDDFKVELLEYYVLQLEQLLKTAPTRLQWMGNRESWRARKNMLK